MATTYPEYGSPEWDAQFRERQRRREHEELARAPWRDDKPPIWARVLGCRRHSWEGFRRGKATFRTWYGEVTVGDVELALSLGSYGRPHLLVAVPGFKCFFRLPLFFNKYLGREIDCERKKFGFNTFDGSIHFHWGHKYKIVNMPWGWRASRGEYLAEDGLYYADKYKPASWKSEELVGPPCWQQEFPYHYMIQPSGEAQHLTATVGVRRWGMRWMLLGLTIKREMRYAIDVAFSEEVGSERGSWKGGCVGCGYDMKPGETPGQTLRRMQRERSFDR